MHWSLLEFTGVYWSALEILLKNILVHIPSYNLTQYTPQPDVSTDGERQLQLQSQQINNMFKVKID